ncbi:serine/threonine-protein kinase [Actinomadura sp. KC345]|uniref:serine/threonine-protein kinase n=1 Tax=Actinomadura sp. KC345 TaxID=2530371 RepID=UPI001404EBF0|nr:serine/threonine-protein kinase [Actinomadura sp. KC345]
MSEDPSSASSLPSKAVPRRAGDPERIGEYEVAGFLGEGGMGSVYLGRGPGPGGGLVAIKVVRSDHARHGAFRERFRHEAAHALKVPRFCTAEVLDADPDAANPYLVTEYIDGPTLGEAIEEGGPLRRAEVEQLGVSMAAALAAIHGAGVVHRDLKPGNVLLSRMGPRVIDFGIASALDTTLGLTETGQLVGTPAYMAPELFEGASAGEAGDVFAWGAVMAFATTGRGPFGVGPVPAIAYRIVHREPDLDGIEGALREVIVAALEKDPARRPTARDLLSRLGVAGGDPAAAAGGSGTPRTAADAGAWPYAAEPPQPPGTSPPGTSPPGTPPGRLPPPAPPPRHVGGLPPSQHRPDGPSPVAGGQGGAAPTLPAGTRVDVPAPRPRRRAVLFGVIAAGVALAAVIAAFAVPRLLGTDHSYLDGHYTSSYGDMYVRVDGEEVWMIYRFRGKSRIHGAIQGDGSSIHASYTEGEGTEATGQVRFAIERSGDDVRLDGKWGGSPDALNSDWDARRIDGGIPADISADLENPGLFPAAPG